MKNSVNHKGEEGFSLVEVLVVIALTGIVMWLTFAVYLFGQRYFVNWNQNLSLQNELHVIIQGITEDVYRAERIAGFGEEELILKMDDQNERVYHVKDDTLFRNTRSLPGTSIALAAFRVAAKNNDAKNVSGSDKTETGKVSLFEISLSLTNGTDTLSTTRAVHLRKPSNWNVSDDR
ncbi:MAG: prepilin-type N-terminal cleavage/methylation domain-containing protein [Balneolaceae bacterium]